MPQIIGGGGEAAATEPTSLDDRRAEVSAMVAHDCVVVVRCVEIEKLFLYYSYVRRGHHASRSARPPIF